MSATATATATDRRTAPRFQPAFGTVCQLGPAWPRVALVWNISQTGVSMLFGDPPAAGGELDAVLSTDGGMPGLPVRLCVAHVREMSNGDYLLGARFRRPLTVDELTAFTVPPNSGVRMAPRPMPRLATPTVEPRLQRPSGASRDWPT